MLPGEMDYYKRKLDSYILSGDVQKYNQCKKELFTRVRCYMMGVLEIKAGNHENKINKVSELYQELFASLEDNKSMVEE